MVEQLTLEDLLEDSEGKGETPTVLERLYRLEMRVTHLEAHAISKIPPYPTSTYPVPPPPDVSADDTITIMN